MLTARTILRRLFAMLAPLATLLVLAQGATAEPRVTAVNVAEVEGATRIVVALSQPTAADVFTLINPFRLVVDLHGAQWDLAAQPQVAGHGALEGVRFGHPDGERARLVFDLDTPVSLAAADGAVVESGYQVSVVLGPPGGAVALHVAPEPETELATDPFADLVVAALAPPLPSTTTASLRPPLPTSKPRSAPLLAKPVIVIDPGHGGHDPGALARDGRYEKAITLQAARELADLLERTGRFTVHLTRDRDEFLPLGERVEIARRHGADLFISLHCDAIEDHSVRGATVYTLSETASDAEADALAAKENDTDLLAAINLVSASYDQETTDILLDLTRRDTMNASARFAAVLSTEVGRIMALRRNTHRFAGFRVLKAPDVPSVLFEMGYVSNRKDLAILADPDSRRGVMRAVVDAIDRYFAVVTASGT